MNWRVPPIWEDGEVWILGGGPSLPIQFGVPESVIREVVEGRATPAAYSPYMSAIHTKHVIGINVSYLLGDWVDMVFFGDNKFFLAHKQGLFDFRGLKISCHDGTRDYSWVKYLPRDPKHPRGISSNPGTVSWNSNSGAAAISVAANAGAKRIVLVGFDMSLNSNGNQHWHNLYKTAPIPTPIVKAKRPNGRTLPFDKHLLGFSNIFNDAKLRGIEIINACPTSAITQFPKYTVKELLFDNT